MRQPWAWAIAHGEKTVENRTRNIAGQYRGLVAIHAAGPKPDDRAYIDAALTSDYADWAAYADQLTLDPPLHVGAVIAVVDLVDVHDAADCYDRSLLEVARLYREDRAAFDALPDNGLGGLIGKARMCSPWAMPDHKHLVMKGARLVAPVPAKGRLGLWRPASQLHDEILLGLVV